MVTVLYTNGAKTFKNDGFDVWGVSDYAKLIENLEKCITDSYYNDVYQHRVKVFGRLLIHKDCLI